MHFKFIFIGLLLLLIAVSVSADSIFHSPYPAPFERFINLRMYNDSHNAIVYSGMNRSYYQKVSEPDNGVYYLYYSDVNVTTTLFAIANSTDGNNWHFVRFSVPTGHPYVIHNAAGQYSGTNADHIYFIWDQTSTGHATYKKEIMVYYSNSSDGSGLKKMGWMNYTWMIGNSNNGTISGNYGIDKIFYNASGNGGHSKNPYDYKYAIYFDCAGGSSEGMCVVGTDDPLKVNRSSLHKLIINDTPGAWDNLKSGYGDIIWFKGYYLAWYEGGKVATREAMGNAYSLNGSSRFTRMANNPILKKSSDPYLNKSVGGASLEIFNRTRARLYVAGMNYSTASRYQLVEFLYDIRQDKNISISGITSAAFKIMNRTGGVLYSYNASSNGDKILLLTGVKYNIQLNPDKKNALFIKGLNASNAGDMVVKVQTASSKPSGIQAFSSVVYSSATGFDVATLYFNKSVTPDKICSCSDWNTSLALCNNIWVCNVTSDYQHGSNATQYWINVTHFSGYGIGNSTPYSPPSIISVTTNTSSVLQGHNFSIDVNVNKGANNLGFVWFDYNGTSSSVVSAMNGSNYLTFITSGKLGNYIIGGHVNDSNSTSRTMVGPNVNIYTTTTTSTTSTTISSSTTTTLFVPLTVSENPTPVFSPLDLIGDNSYVIRDNVGYKLYYPCGVNWDICVATSSDGISWTPLPGYVILNDGTYAGGSGHANPMYFPIGFAGANKGLNASSSTMHYRMWFQDSSVGIAGFMYSESPDGLHWYNFIHASQYGPAVMDNNHQGTHYGIVSAVYTPGASNTGTDWAFRMYVNVQYELTNPVAELPVMAFSANGYNWTGYDPTSVGYATPVFLPTFNGNDFDGGHIGWFKVIKNGPTDWEAFYSGGNDSSGYVPKAGIGYATSTDGIHWVRRQTIITTDNPVQWRSTSTWMPSVVKTENDYQMWFLGSNITGPAYPEMTWQDWRLGYINLSSTASTTTTTTTSTTTTTIVGSLKITVSNSSGTNYGATVSITRSNGTIIVDKTVSQSVPVVNTSTLHNVNNCVVKVTFTTNDSIKILNYNMNTINKTFAFQTTNFSGVKPLSLRKIESNVVASNSNNGKSTVTLNTLTEPKTICSCVNWDFTNLLCSGTWTCVAAASYEHKFSGGKFTFNVTHFSAYVVGAGEYLSIWDDTNDLQGEHIKHYANQYFGFYGNFSNSSNHPISPSMGGYCTFSEVSSGYWSGNVNMSYNTTSKLYYIYKNISANPGVYQYNVTCNDSTGFYSRLTTLDFYVLSARTLLKSSTDWAEVYWWSAESVAHTIHYGIVNSTLACDQTHLFYVDGINGTERRIDASTDKTGQHKCQNATQGAIAISNDGSVSIDINASFSQVTPGVTMKMGHDTNAWQLSCNGSCGPSSCDLSNRCLVVNITQVRILYSLPINTSKEYWMWADFKKVTGTKEPTKGNLTTVATKTK